MCTVVGNARVVHIFTLYTCHKISLCISDLGFAIQRMDTDADVWRSQGGAGRLGGAMGMPTSLGFMGMAGMGPMTGMGMGHMGMGMGNGMNMGMGMGMLGNPAMGMGFGGMGGGMVPSMSGRIASPMGGGMGGQAMAPVLMAEDEYIRTCEEHAVKTGMQVSRQQIKQHYQQIVAQMMGR